LSKIISAIKILSQNFTLIGSLAISVSLPIQIIINCIPFDSLSSELRVASLTGAIFYPLTTGAILHAIFAIHRKETINYAQSMSAGFQCWGRLVNTSIRAGIYICLRLLLLVVPGIILAIEYSFMESLIVNEGMGTRAMSHSQKLTKGKKWEIFWTQLGIWLIIVAVYIATALLQTSLGLENNFIANLTVACLFDLIILLSPIINALFYLDSQAVSNEQTYDELPS
jgi:uncharacterized membrane protein